MWLRGIKFNNPNGDVGDDLYLDKDGSVGTLEIIGGSLTFPNSSGDGFGKSVKVGSLGNFTNISQITFANTSVLIDLDAGHFENNGGRSILGGANALAQLRVADQIKNNDTCMLLILYMSR